MGDDRHSRPPRLRPARPATRRCGSEIRDLYEEIGDLLDDDRVESLPDYFTDDCLYKVTSRENHDQGLPAGTIYCDGIGMLRDRILAIRETQVYEPRSWRHFISGVRVLGVDGDTFARAPISC